MKPDFDPFLCDDVLKSKYKLVFSDSRVTAEDNGKIWVYKIQDKQWYEEIVSTTAIYIENIPDDATEEELQLYFKKCGLIMINDDETLKIKLYGNNDARIVFLKEASVEIAINIYDETPLRPNGPLMKISRAKFLNYTTDAKHHQKSKPTRKYKNSKLTNRQKLEKKLEWYELEKNSKHEKTVVLKHIFRPLDLINNASLLIELKEDVTSEAEKVGKVKSVVLYDLHPDGVVVVKFADALAAKACIELMNNRVFDGLTVEASLYDGKEKFKHFKSQSTVDLEAFGEHLESGSDMDVS